jgi:hypothetical protein
MGHPRTGQLSLVNIPGPIHDDGRFGKAGLPKFLGCPTCCRPNGVGCAVAAAAPGEKQSDDAGTQPGSSPQRRLTGVHSKHTVRSAANE